jgi:ubiquinone biosynthesis O-methyltransferase
MNPVRHDFIRTLLHERPLASGASRFGNDGTIQERQAREALRFLDVGCGGGIFAESAARLKGARHVTGIDPSREVLAVARAHARQDPGLYAGVAESGEQQLEQVQVQPPPSAEPRLRYVQSSIEALPLPKTRAGQYDVVSLFEVLEHVARPDAVVARAAQFLRPGGWLVGSTIARTWASYLTTKLLAEDVLRVVPRGTHDWGKYINTDELRGMVEGRGGVEEVGEADGGREWCWGRMEWLGVVYLPGLGWKEFPGGEHLGNYFFAVRKEWR